MQLDTSKAVFYHDGDFPPQTTDYALLMPSLLEATDALARYDQMLQGMHNNEIFLAPLRNQEAVLSSRMEGTFSTRRSMPSKRLGGRMSGGTMAWRRSFTRGLWARRKGR